MEAALAYFGLIIPIMAFLWWVYTRYMAAAADGKITLDEVVDFVEDAVEKVEDLVEEIEDAKGE